MKELNLTVEKRDATGKGPNRRLRATGHIPAVVYGPEMEPISVRVNYLKLYHLMHGVPQSTIINLDIEGADGPTRKVLIRELQKDPLSGNLLHIDFHQIPLDKPITLTIPVKVIGTPIGVSTFGGILQRVRRTIDISCLPADIPDDIEIDISELNVGDSVHVSSLKIKNVTILTDPVRTIVTVVAPTVIKEPAVAAAEEEEVEAAEKAEDEAKEEEAKPEGEEKKEEGGKEKKK
jgi:large subunit ribosomal protein L25